jgi:hypothetical protein
MIDKNTDEQVDAALAALDRRVPQAADSTEAVEQQQPGQGGTPSRTLQGLEPLRRPKDNTACETCPNSVWFTSLLEVKCYCRVMYLISWSTQEPNRITLCDGVFIGQQD